MGATFFIYVTRTKGSIGWLYWWTGQFCQRNGSKLCIFVCLSVCLCDY